jgi:hypothetical protein
MIGVLMGLNAVGVFRVPHARPPSLDRGYRDGAFG